MNARTAASLTIIALAFPFAFAAPASADDGHATSVDTAVEAILEAQGVDTVSEVDCSAVTDAQLEDLGDAVMAVMHPDEREHEAMDAMMGGEGSEQLAAMHRLMGARYLDCSAAGPYYGMGMMGGYGMMGGTRDARPVSRAAMKGYGYGMMGDAAPSVVTTVLLWTFLGLGAAWFATNIFRRGSKH